MRGPRRWAEAVRDGGMSNTTCSILGIRSAFSNFVEFVRDTEAALKCCGINDLRGMRSFI